MPSGQEDGASVVTVNFSISFRLGELMPALSCFPVTLKLPTAVPKGVETVIATSPGPTLAGTQDRHLYNLRVAEVCTDLNLRDTQ